MLAIIDETEVVSAWSAFLQVDGEEVLLESALVNGGLEEGGLLLRLDCRTISTDIVSSLGY